MQLDIVLRDELDAAINRLFDRLVKVIQTPGVREQLAPPSTSSAKGGKGATAKGAGLLNEKETAKYLCVSIPSLRRWRAGMDTQRRPGPKFVKLPGGGIRYELGDLEAWIEAHKRGGKAE